MELKYKIHCGQGKPPIVYIILKLLFVLTVIGPIGLLWSHNNRYNNVHKCNIAYKYAHTLQNYMDVNDIKYIGFMYQGLNI
jgi:hypothetical protein